MLLTLFQQQIRIADRVLIAIGCVRIARGMSQRVREKNVQSYAN
jgi:hypothetical protein